jgi:hypothetical protein
MNFYKSQASFKQWDKHLAKGCFQLLEMNYSYPNLLKKKKLISKGYKLFSKKMV